MGTTYQNLPILIQIGRFWEDGLARYCAAANHRCGAVCCLFLTTCLTFLRCFSIVYSTRNKQPETRNQKQATRNKLKPELPKRSAQHHSTTDPDGLWTIREVQHRYGVVYDTARTDLQHLETLGLLDKRREGKVKILYLRAEGFAAALERLREPG